jgi:predicted dehydrogenase
LPLVLRALESGKHVLVEKPAATSAADARQMADAAQRTGRFLMPGHILRFDPRYTAVRRAIEADEIGPVASIYSKRARPRWQFAIYNRAHLAFVTTIHDIDLALWYSRSRVRSVRAYERHVTGAAAPDLLWACLEFENDAIAILHSSWLVPDEVKSGVTDSLEVIGAGGLLRVDPGSGFEQWSSQGRESPDFSIHHHVAGATVGALHNELGYLCNCILSGQPPVHVPFADAVHGLQVAEAIVQSARMGEVVSV